MMTTSRTSSSIFEDIPCLRQHAARIDEYLGDRRAESGIRLIRFRFDDFARWAREMEREAELKGKPRTILQMPVEPGDLAAYAEWLDYERGFAVSSISSYVSAIGALHIAAGFLNPTGSAEVKDVLVKLRDEDSDEGLHRARAFSVAELDSILATLPARRRTRGNNMESVEGARKRANVDRALLLTMIGAGMRSSEAAELTWHRVRQRRDGAGRVFMPVKRKASQGEWILSNEEFLKALMILLSEDEDWVFGIFHPSGEWLVVDEECLQALAAILPAEGVDRHSRVFNLSRSQVIRRLKRMAEEAGIDPKDIGGYTPRATLFSLMRARRTPMGKVDFQMRLGTLRVAYSPLPDGDVVPPRIQRLRLKAESEGMSVEMAKEIFGKYMSKGPLPLAFRVLGSDPPDDTRDKWTSQERDDVDIKAPAIELNDDKGFDRSQPDSQVVSRDFIASTPLSDC